MKDKKITLNQEAKKELIEGVKILNDAVKSTLGPNGSTVVIEAPGKTIVTKDGVTVASEIQLADPIKNMGVSLVKQVSQQAAKLAGDGTTTATILATAIIEEGYKAITVGANANGVKRGIDTARKVYLDILKDNYVSEIEDEQDITNVATISSNNDKEMGELIANALKEVGVNGAINVENSNTSETFMETIEGYQLENRGYKSPYFITDEVKNICEYNNPLILLTEATITTNKEIMNALNLAKQADKPILIIAEDVDGEALSTLVVNKLRQTLQCVAIKAPMFGQFRTKIMEDLSIITGAKVFNTPTNNVGIEDVKIEDLGSCDKIVIDDNKTTIIGGVNNFKAIDERIENLEKELQTVKNQMHIDFIQERMAKLAGGVAQIFIGAHTEAELKEKKDRLEDALHATRAALEEGIVAGGGITFIRIKDELSKYLGENASTLSNDEVAGFKAFIGALNKPLLSLLDNTSSIDDTKIYYDVISNKNNTFGYNVLTSEFGDMLKMGVIDPAKVNRVAVETAVSIAGSILTTNCVITYDDHDRGSVDIAI